MSKGLWEQREALDVPVEDVAEHVGVSPETVLEWERAHSVPWRSRKRFSQAVWFGARDSIAEQSGIAECRWVAENAADEEAMEGFHDHFKECSTCQRRSEYVEAHLGPPPLGVFNRLVMRVGLWLDGLADWQRSALGGAGALLLMGGLGVPYLLLLAIEEQNAGRVLEAIGLVVVLFTSGSLAGIAYHLTRAWRQAGRRGLYASAVATVAAYWAAIMAIIAIAGRFIGWESAGSDLHGLVAEPTGWVISAVMVLVFGVAFGWSLEKHGSSERKAA